MVSKQELIKPIVKVGNSAGVILPREWLNGKARVELIERPLDIQRDILELLSDYLGDILGIYLAGSYAREEQTNKSDVDVLVITNNTNKQIKSGKYEVILISREKLERQIKENALPLIPMLREAKTIINSELIKSYKDSEVTKKNLKFHIETTKSALKIVKNMLEIEKLEGGIVSCNPIYSLMLRLRGAYIIDCLIKNKFATTKGLLELIDQLGVKRSVYEVYLSVKSNKPCGCDINYAEASKLYEYIDKRIKEHERWAKERNN